MSRPIKLPTYATDATLTAGLEIGSATRLQPSDGQLAQGFYADARLPARMLAWILGVIGDWIGYQDLKSVAGQAINWPVRASVTTTSVVNTTIGLAWSSSLGASNIAQHVFYDTTKKVYRSFDGQDWAASAGGLALTNGSTTIPDVAAGLLDGAGAIMANGGVSGHCYTTADGTNWTNRGGPLDAHSVLAYAPSLNKWVGLGSTRSSQVTGTVASFGAGGVPWSNGAYPGNFGTTGGGGRRVVWNGSCFIATPLGSYNKFLRSTDAINWTEVSVPSSAIWSGVAYSAEDGLWLATSTGTSLAYSTDNGVTWGVVANLPATGANDLACYGTLWVIATGSGNSGGIRYSIDKGQTWTPVVVGQLLSGASLGWLRVIQGDQRFAVARTDGVATQIAMSQKAIL